MLLLLLATALADTWFVDADADGFGDDTLAAFVGGTPPAAPHAWSRVPGDCDDGDFTAFPGAPEWCDGADDDCDGEVDEDIAVRWWFFDGDLDGFGDGDPDHVISVACGPVGFSPFPDDCDDRDPDVHPLVTAEHRLWPGLTAHPVETSEADRDPTAVADGIDQDCDGGDVCPADLDRDGFGGAELLADDDLNCRNASSFTATNQRDCDDGDPRSFPGAAEVVGDGQDQDCDGADDCFEDLDGDGFGSDDVVTGDGLDCDDGGATASRDGDCNDDPAAGGAGQSPTEPEACDGVDDDCDGTIDEVLGADAEVFYRDVDGDGYGDPTQQLAACGEPSGYARRAGDCDDDDRQANPGQVELCDGIDDDCDGVVDEDDALDAITWHLDADGDGLPGNAVSERACEEPDGDGWVPSGAAPFDCDDADAAVGSCPGPCAVGSPTPLTLPLALLALLGRRRTAANARRA